MTSCASSLGTVTFAPGQVSAQATIQIIGEGLFESNEDFHVTFANPVGINLSRTSAALTILNDDTAPVVSVAATDSAASEQGANPLVFTVTRSASQPASLSTKAG